MIDLSFLSGSTLAVFGLGRSGLATAKALVKGGATVLAWDDSADNRAKAKDAGLSLLDPKGYDWKSIDSLVLSPGVPLTHPKPNPIVVAAKKAAVEIIGDIQLLSRADPYTPIIGITGTNGKSTTTALIAHILEKSGKNIQVGGNLGTPVLSFERLGGKGFYVLELSSYQLDLMHNVELAAAVFLNVSPDHIDRHGDINGYVIAKRRIFDGLNEGAAAVVGIDDPTSIEVGDDLARQGRYKVLPISGRIPAHGGVYAMRGMLVDDTTHRRQSIADLKIVPTLTGEHNHQNAAAAYATVIALGITSAQAASAIKTFPGLAHRQELVATSGSISFVNDSKATNAVAAAKALSSYDDIYWIAGGQAKAGGIDELGDELNTVRHAYLIGEAAHTFAETLHGKIDHTICGDLETAIKGAYSDAYKSGRGGVILLSPACSSFDQYRDFEARGEAFRELAAGITGKNNRGAA